MGREARAATEQRWVQLTAALLEMRRNLAILEARIKKLEAYEPDSVSERELHTVHNHEDSLD